MTATHSPSQAPRAGAPFVCLHRRPRNCPKPLRPIRQGNPAAAGLDRHRDQRSRRGDRPLRPHRRGTLARLHKPQPFPGPPRSGLRLPPIPEGALLFLRLHRRRTAGPTATTGHLVGAWGHHKTLGLPPRPALWHWFWFWLQLGLRWALHLPSHWLIRQSPATAQAGPHLPR